MVEFDEDELDEAQTEADVKNITTKHQITIEELKREVLGSVKQDKRLVHKVVFFCDQPHQSQPVWVDTVTPRNCPHSSYNHAT